MTAAKVTDIIETASVHRTVVADFDQSIFGQSCFVMCCWFFGAPPFGALIFWAPLFGTPNGCSSVHFFHLVFFFSFETQDESEPVTSSKLRAV